jgi:hypothetical protein
VIDLKNQTFVGMFCGEIEPIGTAVSSLKRRRFPVEQITGILKEAEPGTRIAELYR